VPEDICRFQLTTGLPRCGRADAVKILFSEETGWCDGRESLMVVDSLGIVPGELPAGMLGWAKWMPD